MLCAPKDVELFKMLMAGRVGLELRGNPNHGGGLLYLTKKGFNYIKPEGK